MAFCIAIAVRTWLHTRRGAVVGGRRRRGVLRRTDVGGLALGQRAHFVVLDAPSYRIWPTVRACR
jgi:hypothetical protein